MISAAQLVAAGLAPSVAATFAAPLSAACARFGIDTPARIAGFVAQCRVESTDFTHLVESLNYTHAERIVATFPREVPTLAAAYPLVERPQELALAVYSNRLGNGPRDTGDGWKYIGRGIGQITGRRGYAAAQSALGRPYLAHPELLEQPEDACLTAAWYWQTDNCNAMADAHDWNAITLAFNGRAMLKAVERAALSVDGLAIFQPEHSA
jgi:putative chitinase